MHLRVCVQHLMRTPTETVRGMYRKDGDTLDVSSVAAYVRAWKSFFSWWRAFHNSESSHR